MYIIFVVVRRPCIGLTIWISDKELQRTVKEQRRLQRRTLRYIIGIQNENFWADLFFCGTYSGYKNEIKYLTMDMDVPELTLKLAFGEFFITSAKLFKHKSSSADPYVNSAARRSRGSLNINCRALERWQGDKSSILLATKFRFH